MPYVAPMPDDETELVHPLLCVAMDRATGENIFFELVPMPKLVDVQQFMLWQMLESLPVQPSKVFVRKEVHNNVLPLAKVLGLELVISEVPVVEEFREFMENTPLQMDDF